AHLGWQQSCRQRRAEIARSAVEAEGIALVEDLAAQTCCSNERTRAVSAPLQSERWCRVRASHGGLQSHSLVSELCSAGRFQKPDSTWLRFVRRRVRDARDHAAERKSRRSRQIRR